MKVRKPENCERSKPQLSADPTPTPVPNGDLLGRYGADVYFLCASAQASPAGDTFQHRQQGMGMYAPFLNNPNSWEARPHQCCAKCVFKRKK